MEKQNDILVSPDGFLTWNGEKFRCAVGKGGILEDKKEGDGGTPVGCFSLREVFYRADKIEKPTTILPIRALLKTDGWCDESNDPNYNKLVSLPYTASHEELWREDDLYDIIVPVGYNDDPPIPGKGSAIFIHVASPALTPTAGCIAMSLQDLLKILSEITPETKICISK